MKTPDSHPEDTHVAGAGDPAPVPTVVIGLAGALLVFFITLVIEAGYYIFEAQENETKAAWTESGETARVRFEQVARISEYRAGDGDTVPAAIPIERAMELVIAERAGAGGVAE